MTESLEQDIIKSREIHNGGITPNDISIEDDVLIGVNYIIEREYDSLTEKSPTDINRAAIENGLDSNSNDITDEIYPSYIKEDILSSPDIKNVLQNNKKRCTGTICRKLNEDKYQIISVTATRILRLDVEHPFFNKTILINKDNQSSSRTIIEESEIKIKSDNENDIYLSAKKTNRISKFTDRMDWDVTDLGPIAGMLSMISIFISLTTSSFLLFSTFFMLVPMILLTVFVAESAAIENTYDIREKTDNEFFVSNLDINNTEINREPKVISAKTELTENKLNIVAEEEDICWSFNKDDGIIPEDAVQLFESIGINNIDEKNIVLKINKNPEKEQESDNMIVSECGDWAIDISQNISTLDERGNEKELDTSVMD